MDNNEQLLQLALLAVPDVGDQDYIAEFVLKLIADVDRALLLHDAALRNGRAGLAVFLVHVEALHGCPGAFAVDLDHTALLATGYAGQHLHHVTFLDMQLLLHDVQSTSGAREMIFMNFFSRSSLATGPKMRVPRISPAASSSTTALSSKRM